jgi:single-stranded DNA-binding protein
MMCEVINKNIEIWMEEKYISIDMEIKGKVHEIGAIQQVSETFKKRDLIVEYAENPTYPEYIRFEALQDKTALFDSLKPGDEIEVSFNLRGRPWTNKDGVTSYFNSLVVWRITALTNAGAAAPAAAPQYAAPVDVNTNAGEDDDLPF